MPRIAYENKKFQQKSLDIIAKADAICTDYERRGYNLTLRQIFYRFVSNGWIENSQREYKNLGQVLNDARLAGLLDWNHMEDRTRNLRKIDSWSDRSSILYGSAEGFKIDPWINQPVHVEVWVEKDALVGVIGGAANKHRLGFFSCRGYTSQSELWAAAMRLNRAAKADKRVVVIHLGDHDPSGIDMTRDITERLDLFMTAHGYDPAEVVRIALNMDQVEQYDPPPNPAKLSDSRAGRYIDRFGESSWELDALTPEILEELISAEVEQHIDKEAWDRDMEFEESQRERLMRVADREARLVAEEPER